MRVIRDLPSDHIALHLKINLFTLSPTLLRRSGYEKARGELIDYYQFLK